MNDTELHTILNMPISSWGVEIDEFSRHEAYVEASLKIKDLEDDILILKFLCEPESFRINEAKKPKNSNKVLTALLVDKSCLVRVELAKNYSSCFKILKVLAKDKIPLVRAAVARNPNTPFLVLEKLTNDEMLSVRQAVRENPNFIHIKRGQTKC